MSVRYFFTLCLLTSISLISCNKDATSGNQIPADQFEAPWPKWVFGHWIWEDEGTSASAKQIADDYLAHGIPVDAIIIDSPWETGYNTFDWDDKLYPDAKGMIDYFHSKDIRVLLWITGIINTDSPELYKEAEEKNYFMKTGSKSAGPGMIDWWKGQGSLIDWWNPDAVAWWKSKMDKVLDMGIDGWKTDGTDYFEVLSQYSPAAGRNINRLDYSHAYYRLFHEYTREKLGNDRVIMSRPADNYGLGVGGDIVAFTPVDITFAGWVGDQDADFKGLRAALDNLYYSADLGYLIIGSDIGGYREDNSLPLSRDKETFIRWAQLGAFCPLMENGGGGEHRPWKFDDETLNIYKKFVNLHLQMGDYLNENAKIYYQQGKSLMHFQYKSDYSYFLGPDIFVTPVKRAGNEVTVRFPAADTWVYLFDKTKEYKGGTTETLNFPLDEFPVFVKKTSKMLHQLNP